MDPFVGELTDPELVHALNQQHPQAPRATVTRFSPVVRGVLRRALGVLDELEDAEQEVFSKLFRSISTLRDPASLRAFVIGIALRTAFSERRRRHRRVRLGLAAENAQVTVPIVPDNASASYAVARLDGLLSRLCERDRAVFVLRLSQGQTIGEVAATLNISESTARRSLSRAQDYVSKCAARDPFLFDYFFDLRAASRLKRVLPPEAHGGQVRRSAHEHGRGELRSSR